jgi:hypothetical protein
MPDFSAYYFTPADRGYIAESVPGPWCGGTAAFGTAGTMQFVRIKVPQASLCTNITLDVHAVGSSLTAGQCFVALYTDRGVLIAQSVDQAANWAGTGQKNAQLDGGPYYLAVGEYYVGIWFNGTTGPTFPRATPTGTIGAWLNNNTAAPNLRYGSANTGLTTAAPSTMGTQTAGGAVWWVALS